jgi:hypothetical protein
VVASLHAGMITETFGQRVGGGGASSDTSGTPRRKSSAATAVNDQYTIDAIAATNRTVSTMPGATSCRVPPPSGCALDARVVQERQRHAALTVSHPGRCHVGKLPTMVRGVPACRQVAPTGATQ